MTRAVGEWLPQDLARLRETERAALARLEALRARDAEGARYADEGAAEIEFLGRLLAGHGEEIRVYDTARAKFQAAEAELRACRSRNSGRETPLALTRLEAVHVARAAIPALPRVLTDPTLDLLSFNGGIEGALRERIRRVRARVERVPYSTIRVEEQGVHDAAARRAAAEALAVSAERLRSFAAALTPREAALLRTLGGGSRPKRAGDANVARLCALGLAQRRGASLAPTPLGEAVVASCVLATGRAAPLSTPVGERRKAFGVDTRAALVAATRAALAQLAEEDAPEGVVGTVSLAVADEIGTATYELRAEPAALRRLLLALGEQTDEAPPAGPGPDPPPFVPGRFL